MITPDKQFWEVFKETHGAFSTAEAVALINIAAQAPAGKYLELGTHKGKSTLAACFSLKEGDFNLVDPIFSDDDICSGIAKIFIDYPSTHIQKKLFADVSENVIPMFKDLSYVFVDSGDHGEDLVKSEILLLEDRVIQGGIIAFHDFKNQFTAVERWYNYLIGIGKYEQVDIDWDEIFEYVKENNLEEGNNSWHQYPELPHPPNFVGALKRK